MSFAIYRYAKLEGKQVPHFLLDNSNPNRQYYCLLIVRPILFVSIDHLSSDGGASKYCLHQYYRSNQKAALRISHLHMGRERNIRNIIVTFKLNGR